MVAIFHITNVANIPSILEQGGLWCDRERLERCPNAVNIAYQDLKERRAQKPVDVGPRGTLADYVPFYFAPRSPMLFAIHKGLVQGYAGGQRGVVHLVSSCEAIRDDGLRFVFTDGHAVKRFTSQFDNLDQLNEIDWPLMKATYWHDTDEDNDRKRRRQAEFLVRNFVPWTLVERLVVMDGAQADSVRGQLAACEHCPDVVVRRDYYYL